MTLIASLDGFIDQLRSVGLPISVSEKIDATAALGVTDLSDREAVKSGLAVTLVKSSDHESAFDTIFDIFFGSATSETNAGRASGGNAGLAGPREQQPAGSGLASPGDGRGAGGSLDGLDDAAIRQLLIESLDSARQGTLLQRQLARIIVERNAGIRPGRAVAGTYYLYRAMLAVDPQHILTQLVERADARDPGAADDQLARRLLIEDFERRIASFRLTVEAEIRRRLVADRGTDAVARTLRRPLPEDIGFLTAAAAQVDQLRGVLQPLSRKLAGRIAARRMQRRRGTVDFRATMRASLSTGGVPVDVRYHGPRPAKPQLVVLADISGSVSAFAAFTLQLAYAMRAQFSRVRCYVFVDGLDEVTPLLERARSLLDVTSEINRLGLGVWLDGRSDYGNAIDTFLREHGAVLHARTTVLILGDARSNYHSPRAEALGKIAGRAGQVFWLNPEPSTAWDSGDSVIGQYARHCDEVVECRNLRQLRAFVDRLA
jgi:uncharacterized protein